MSFFDQFSRWFGRESASEKIQVLLNNSNDHKARGHFQDALALLDEAAQLVPSSAKDTHHLLMLRRVDVHIAAGQPAEAEALLDALYDEAASTLQPYIWVNYGRLDWLREKRESARTQYERALSLARSARTPEAEGRAQGYLAETYLHDENISFALYLLQEALPKIRQANDPELDSYFSGRLGEALLYMGREAEGQAYLGRALRLAEKLRHYRYEQLWRRALADQAMTISNFGEARRHYMLVLASYDTADSSYPVILCRLSKACLSLSELDAALDYARQAFELTAQSGSDTALLAQVAYGIALRSLGDMQKARPLLEQAAVRYEALSLNRADYSFVDVLRNLAACQAETGDDAAAQLTYEQALASAQKEGSTLDVAGTYRDLGILQTRQGNLKQAVKTWMEALKLYEAEGEYARVARLYCDIANIRKQQGEGQRALKDYEQALMLLSSINDLDTRGVVLSNAATAYVDQGDIETAESFFEEAIKIAQKINDRHAEATRRGNYGWFLMSTGRARRAQATLAYALRQSENLDLRLAAAVQTDNLGLSHDELEEYAEAEKYHRDALNRVKTLHAPFWEASFEANLAHTLLALGRTEEALPLLNHAHSVATTLNNAELMARAANGLARIALNTGDLESAAAHLETAIQQAAYGSKRRLLADALILRSSLYAHQNKPQDAQTDWARAAELLRVLRINPDERRPAWLQ